MSEDKLLRFESQSSAQKHADDNDLLVWTHHTPRGWILCFTCPSGVAAVGTDGLGHILEGW